MSNSSDYDLVPERLRSMSESQLVVEERQAREALNQQVMNHLDDAQHDNTIEGLTVELRFLEAELALNLKVRDNTIQNQLATERARSGQLSDEDENLVRSLVRGTFADGINRAEQQLRNCREKLQKLEDHK